MRKTQRLTPCPVWSKGPRDWMGSLDSLLILRLERDTSKGEDARWTTSKTGNPNNQTPNNQAKCFFWTHPGQTWTAAWWAALAKKLGATQNPDQGPRAWGAFILCFHKFWSIPSVLLQQALGKCSHGLTWIPYRWKQNSPTEIYFGSWIVFILYWKT